LVLIESPCDFVGLLVITNFGVWTYLIPFSRKKAFPTPPLFDAPARGNPYNFWMKLTPQKLEGWGYTVW